MAAGLMFIPIMFLFGILFFIFWILMLVDAITRKFKNETDKVVWILVIILASLLGALIYYFVGYQKKERIKWFWMTLLSLVILLFVLAVVIGLVNSVV